MVHVAFKTQTWLTKPQSPAWLSQLVLGCFTVYAFHYIQDITGWCEDMNFIFEWQNNILQMSVASE